MKVKKCGRFATPVTQALGAFDDNGYSTALKFPCVSIGAVHSDMLWWGQRAVKSIDR